MTGDATAERGTGALEIATRSGRVVVWARPIARAEVLDGDARIEADGVVRSGASGRVEIACPEGSDVMIGSSSGRVECHGPLGRVAVTGSSGRISIDDAREIEVRTASGRVLIGRCTETCRVVVTSGAVEIDAAGAVVVTVESGRLEVGQVGDALVRSGSGGVVLGVDGTGTVDVSTLSGRVSIAVPAGVQPDLHLVTRSGRIRSDVEPGADGRVAVESHSGSIRVSRA